MNKSIMQILLPLCALAFTPAYAKSDADQARELEQARKELQQAREELQRAAREMQRVTRERGHESPRAHAYQFMADQDRAVLGVILGRGPKQDGKLTGVRVDAVTPGSGAEKAGLKSGDVIVTVKGKSIAQKDRDDERPGEKLREALDELKVGDQVRIGYEREGKKAEVTVTASRPEPSFSGRMPAIPAIPPIPPMPPMAFMGFDDDEEHDILIPGGERRVIIRRGGDHGWELEALDESLEPYFKTREGVLVVKAKADNKLGVKSGDVVQRINGDKVSQPRELMRALDKLDPGAEIKLDIVRLGKSETLKGKAPERGERNERRFEKRIEIEADEGG